MSALSGCVLYFEPRDQEAESSVGILHHHDAEAYPVIEKPQNPS